jgi:hypothetical protein
MQPSSFKVSTAAAVAVNHPLDSNDFGIKISLKQF